MPEQEPAAPEVSLSEPSPTAATQPDTPAPSEEPEAMIEIHPAPHTATTRSEFFVHIATIVLGLLIAVGLEQTVLLLEHRHQIAETRKVLALERKQNDLRAASAAQEWRRQVGLLQANMAVFRYLEQHPDAPPAQWPGRIHWLIRTVSFDDSAWLSAQQSGILMLMPQSEVRLDAGLYRNLSRYNELAEQRRALWLEAAGYTIEEPDASHLDRSQLEHELELLHGVLLAEYREGNLLNNLSAAAEDFTGAPTREELSAIVRGYAVTDDNAADFKTIIETQKALAQAVMATESDSGK